VEQSANQQPLWTANAPEYFPLKLVDQSANHQCGQRMRLEYFPPKYRGSIS
jgi:hypothetical protein